MWEELIYAASLAPSAHNNQPWKFKVSEGGVDVLLDRKYLLPELDPTDHQSYISLGACIENLRIAALGSGLEPTLTLFPDGEDGDRVAEFQFKRGHQVTEEERRLMQAIPLRTTPRIPYSRKPIPDDLVRNLQQAASREDAHLRVAMTGSEIDRIARQIDMGDAICFNHERIQQEVYSWMRFSDEQKDRMRDGMWIRTFATDPVSVAVSPQLLRWETLRVLNRLGTHRILGLRSRLLAKKCAAMGLLTMPDISRLSYVRGGQVFQRLQLEATLHGLMVQPHSSIPLLSKMAQAHPERLSPSQAEQVARANQEMRSAFGGVGQEEAVILLFRLGYASPGRFREPRRTVEQLLCP